MQNDSWVNLEKDRFFRDLLTDTRFSAMYWRLCFDQIESVSTILRKLHFQLQNKFPVYDRYDFLSK